MFAVEWLLRGLRGDELARELRERQPRTEIIVKT
jgi:hypothetical protein